jgi:hypothetical protein
VLALLVVGPLLGPGYLLLRDAVSTPRSYLSDTALGLGESAPRASPQDFAVALASQVLDGGVVVKVLLLLGLWLAGWGAARLVELVLPEAGRPGQFVAVTMAVWNPYVAERLLQGHWSLLIGYGCLPWVATSMLGLRRNAGRPNFFGLVFWIALAGLTPTGLMLAAGVSLVCALTRGSGYSRWLCGAVTLGAAVLAALPWLTAAALSPSSRAWPHTFAVAVFAARAEPGLGTLGSLASLGGIWNAEAVPASRTTVFALLAAVALLSVVLVGLPVLVRRAAAIPLLVLAVAAVLMPTLLATGPGQATMRMLVEAAPGLAVVRDTQKWVALAMPGYALAGAAAVVTLRRWLRPAATGVVCCVALLAGLPDLAWGVAGQVEPVRYPAGWAAVASVINDDPGPVAVLPAGSMRRFSWSGPAPVLDPLPRWLRADVLSTGDLAVSGVTVPGEGAHARAVQDLLLAGCQPAALRHAGVAWLVVESGTAGDMGAGARTLDSLSAVYRDADLGLYRIGGRSAGAAANQRLAVLIAHLVWLALLVSGAVGTAIGRRPRTSAESSQPAQTGD